MSAKVEVVSKAKVNLKVTTVAGSGGGVSDHGQLTGLLDDDHPQYQRSEATWVSTSSFTITDESIVITTGSAVTLPDAQTHPSRTIGVGAAAQTVTISPAGTDTMFDDPGNSYVLPQGNGITFVSVQISGAWGWAIYTRNGPAFDMPKWYGQSLADGQVLKISGGVPAWGTAPSSGVTSVSGTAPISVATGTTTPVVSISAASTSAAGSMSSADKSKLDGIATGATANSSDATLLARANHTGTQTLSTISDAGTAAAKNVPATGNAASTEVVLGSDTRLTDTRTPTDGSVTTAKLADSAVTSAKIADGTIVNADISASAAIDASKLSGLAAIATSGSASDLSTGTLGTARLPNVVPFYGTGADGDVTVSGTTNLTNDAYYNNLTVTGTLNTANYRVFVAGTLSGSGTIQCVGNTGASGGAAVAVGVFASTGAGGSGGSTTGNQAATKAGRVGGAGGAGGAGSSGAGGAAQTGTAPTNVQGGTTIVYDPTGFSRAQMIGGSTTNLAGGVGGSGGGGDGTGSGGTGGSGGGCIYLAARSVTFTGTISANGGVGQTPATGNRGGGGGGGGGVVMVVTGSPTQTFTATASGGAGGSGTGTGTSGASGGNGTTSIFLGVK